MMAFVNYLVRNRRLSGSLIANFYNREFAPMQRRIDKERIERAAEESRRLIDIERQKRQAKTARLRELRLQQQASVPAADPPRRRATPAKRKPTRRVIEIE